MVMMIYFTGHEKESDLAEGIYTTEYRLYDARVGRWLSVDPLLEKYLGMSPYNYCAGNPVKLVDVDGRQCNPFDYFDGYHFDFFGALNDEWECFKVGCSLRYNSWYNSKVHGNSTLLTSLLLTSEFIFSYGPESREFSNENFSEALKQSNMTTIALKAFQKGYDDYLKGERSIPETYRVDFSIFPGEGDTGPLNEFFEDGLQ